MLNHLLVQTSKPTPAPVSFVEFSVAVRDSATGVTLVDPRGELDLLTSPALDRCLRDQLRDRCCTQLILDVSHLGFCGAAGLRSLLSARELARDQHICLYVVPGPLVGRLLLLSELWEQFTIYADVTAALAATSTVVRIGTTRAPAQAPVSPASRCLADPACAQLRVPG